MLLFAIEKTLIKEVLDFTDQTIELWSTMNLNDVTSLTDKTKDTINGIFCEIEFSANPPLQPATHYV